MVGQGHFCKPFKSIGRIYLPFINEGTTLNKRSSMTVGMACIESCRTGDISSSMDHSGCSNVDMGIEHICYQQMA